MSGPSAMEEEASGGFDLEGYIANYTGHTKIDRLLFVADKTRGTPVEIEALKIAHDELKKTDNTFMYFEVIHRLDGRAGREYAADTAWADATDRRGAARQERLEIDLTGFKVADIGRQLGARGGPQRHVRIYLGPAMVEENGSPTLDPQPWRRFACLPGKTNLIKEAIRRGQEELGEFFYQRGDLQNAFKSCVRSRDYCSTSKHIVSMCLAVVRIAVEMANWMHVRNYVSKAEQTPDVGSDPAVVAKLKAAMGLALLHTSKYKQAARKFVDVNAELGTSYSDVLAPQDVAVYGGLCALATFDRVELQQRVLTNIAFREFLELVPELRDIIRDFHNSKYASSLQSLKALTATLRLDMHLSEHLDELNSEIRQRAVMQYVAPFTTVDLATMATAFNTSVDDLEAEIAGLIMDGKVKARIDSHRKVLCARHADVRGQTFQQVLSAGAAYLRDTKAMLLRASLIQHDFVQKPKGGGMPWGRGARGAGGSTSSAGADLMEIMGNMAEQRGVSERAMLREL